MPFISSIRSVYGPIGKFSRRILSKDAITGGIISSSGGYRIHTFNDVGTNYFNMSMVASALNVEYLIIAGGGGGGGGGGYNTTAYPSGGGAGGYRTGTISSAPANYPVVVGFGGYLYDANPGSWSNGGNSSFNGIISTGGGTTGGTTNNQGSIANVLPQAGGSGAGGTTDAGGYPNTTANYISPGAGISGQGYSGGNASHSLGNYYNPSAPGGQGLYGIYPNGHGGGGGAGGAGGNAQVWQVGTGVGGVGGAGLSSSITGLSIVRASGGGGSGESPSTTVGNMAEPAQTPGGGGRGYYDNLNGAGATTGYTNFSTPGTANTGGGGGGGYSLSSNEGGSGVVILRYPYP